MSISILAVPAAPSRPQRKRQASATASLEEPGPRGEKNNSRYQCYELTRDPVSTDQAAAYKVRHKGRLRPLSVNVTMGRSMSSDFGKNREICPKRAYPTENDTLNTVVKAVCRNSERALRGSIVST